MKARNFQEYKAQKARYVAAEQALLKEVKDSSSNLAHNVKSASPALLVGLTAPVSLPVIFLIAITKIAFSAADMLFQVGTGQRY